MERWGFTPGILAAGNGDGIKQREGWHFASFTSLVLSCLVRVVLLEWDMEVGRVWKGRWI